MVAMAGMFLTGDKTFSSLALATILVVAVAVLGSLTVLPALLSRLGCNGARGPHPAVPRRRRGGARVADGASGAALAARRQRRPGAHPVRGSPPPRRR